MQAVREIVAVPAPPRRRPPRRLRRRPTSRWRFRRSAKGLQVETAGDRVRLQLELPRAQMESVRQTLVPVIRSLADALIGALGG